MIPYWYRRRRFYPRGSLLSHCSDFICVLEKTNQVHIAYSGHDREHRKESTNKVNSNVSEFKYQ